MVFEFSRGNTNRANTLVDRFLFGRITANDESTVRTNGADYLEDEAGNERKRGG
jgi:hypothetical protein